MKSINFIKPLPPKKQRRLAFWFNGSLFLLTSLIFGLMYFYLIQTQQMYQLQREVHELQKKATLFDEYATRKNELQKNKTFFETQLTTLRSFHHQIEGSHHLLSSLAVMTPSSICLSSVNGTPGKLLSLEGVALDAHSVTNFLQKFHNDTTSNMKLAYVTPASQTSPQGKSLVEFKFEGRWNSNQSSYL